MIYLIYGWTKKSIRMVAPDRQTDLLEWKLNKDRIVLFLQAIPIYPIKISYIVCDITVSVMKKGQELVDEILSLPYAIQVIEAVHERLDAEQVLRQKFYDEVSESDKAEFIQGQVILHPPVKKVHNEVSIALLQLLNVYVKKYQLGFVGHEKIMISLTRNDYEPDICFFNLEKSQYFTPDQMLFPSPDLVVEVLSHSTEARDRGIKFQDYEAHGITEYWIIDPDSQTLEQYRLNKKKRYELKLKAQEGTLNCESLPGFDIEIVAIFDEGKHMEALKKLLK